MPAQIAEYKCPACTGPLHFVGESGKLECDYCGSTYDVAEIEALYAGQEAGAKAAFQEAEAKEKNGEPGEEPAWDTSALQGDWGADGEGMKAYNCPSCGAELICDATTAATSCPYCGNNTIVPGQFGGTMKPDYVIPFKLDKKAAVAALKKHYSKKFFLPRAFSSGNHLEEVQGIYVPFWLFDAGAEADCRFHATRSHTHTDGDYRVTVTEHFDVRRSGTMEFERIPVDGSKKMPDDYMNSIEPFDYAGLKSFSTAYLPGYLADKYDVTAQESMERADRRCHNSAFDQMRRDISGYDWCGGFQDYLKKSDSMLQSAREGHPFDVDSNPLIRLAGIGISLLVGCVAAFVIAVWVSDRMMKSVSAKTEAGAYLTAGSVVITGREDYFTHTTETRTKIEKSSGSGGTTVDSDGFSGKSGKF